jgi:hypothetical protein
MKAKDLIEQLKQFPPDIEVKYFSWHPEDGSIVEPIAEIVKISEETIAVR